MSNKTRGGKDTQVNDFVLEKSIFNNVFEKDIRRVFVYKKAERLAKAIHLITPAFTESPALRDRIDTIAIALIDAAIEPTAGARRTLSRELLALSSLLSIARIGGLLSAMNVELIAHEARALLHEVAGYEEPRVFLDTAPSLADMAKQMVRQDYQRASERSTSRGINHNSLSPETQKQTIKDTGSIKDKRTHNRRDTILSVIKNKRKASIKDVSTLIRDVSEKTIQRELLALVAEGILIKEGERRWSTYTLA